MNLLFIKSTEVLGLTFYRIHISSCFRTSLIFIRFTEILKLSPFATSAMSLSSVLSSGMDDTNVFTQLLSTSLRPTKQSGSFDLRREFSVQRMKCIDSTYVPRRYACFEPSDRIPQTLVVFSSTKMVEKAKPRLEGFFSLLAFMFEYEVLAITICQ